MPDEYDAFGRKKDDAGLGDLGWETTAEAQAPAPAPVRPPQRRRRRSPGVPIAGIVTLAVIAGVAALAVSAGKEARDTVRSTLDGFRTPQVDDGDGSVPAQVKARSFFTARALRAGLNILARDQPGRITSFSFRKDRINLQVNRGGRSHNLQLSAGAEAPEEFAVTDASSSASQTLSYAQISPTAMARFMRASNARLGASVKQVDYFVVSRPLGPVQWGIYYKGGKIALGDSRGRFARRIS